MDQTKGSLVEKKGSKPKVIAIKENAGDKPSAPGTGRKTKKNNPNSKPKLDQEELKKNEADRNSNKEKPNATDLQQGPKTEQNKSAQGEIQAKCGQNQQTEPSVTAASQLSEKERRRLEWEKKLAEQKKDAPSQASNKSPSKAELKAQRRAQQEAQRQAKVAADGAAKPSSTQSAQHTNGTTEVVAEKSPKTQKSAAVVAAADPVKKKVQKTVDKEKPLEVPAPICNYSNVHPVFVHLGVRYATRQLIGSNARCIGLLYAMKCLIQDIQVPPGQDFVRYLEQALHSCVSYLERGPRALSMTMTSALRYFTCKLPEVEDLPTEKEKRLALVQSLCDFKLNTIDKSSTLIANKMHKAHVDGLQFATYGCSSLIGNVLIQLHKRKRQFHVYVFETPAVLREGHELMRRLSLEGVPCSYAPLSAARNVLSRVNKLLMGMHTSYKNYSVQTRTGAMLLTEVAQETGTQVVVCHERYKLRGKDDVETIKAIDVIKETVTETLPVRKRPARPIKRKTKFRMVPMKYYHTTFDMVPIQAVSSTIIEVSKIEENTSKRPFGAELFAPQP